MSVTINLCHSPRVQMPFISNEQAKSIDGRENKGWSFSYVYDFSEIRNIYLAIRLDKRAAQKLETFTEFCLSISLPYVKSQWNKRRVLEHLNALKNFALIDKECNIVKQVFLGSNFEAPVSDDDLAVFQDIYFSYFRFREIFTWFLGPPAGDRFDLITRLQVPEIIDRSLLLYSFPEHGAYTDSFLYELKDNTNIYYLDDNLIKGFSRFWDVFVAWGRQLKLIEKFSLVSTGINTVPNRPITCCYLLKAKPQSFDLIDYVKQHKLDRYLYLPDLVYRISTDYRISVEQAQRLIVEQYKDHRERLSFQRTSEAFIGKEKYLFPQYNGSYISHLVVRG